MMRSTTSSTDVEFTRFPKLGLVPAVALSLAPGAAAFCLALVLAPVLNELSLPRTFAIPVAFALVLIPIELTILVKVGQRNGGRGIRGIGGATAFPAAIGRRWWLIPALFVFALVLAVVWSALAGMIWNLFDPVLPNWLSPDADPLDYASRGAVTATAIVTLLIDGILNPIVEEYYFRGFLLPRLPFRPAPAIVASAGLFTVQHFWQPYNWTLIFVLELVLTTAVVRTRSLRLGIVLHVLANTFGAAIALATVLGS